MQHRTFALLAVLGLVAALCAAPLRAPAQDQSRTGTAGQSSGQSSGQSGMGQPGSDQMGGGQDRQSMQDTMQAIRSADTPDKLFLVEAALGSQAEMQLAQLAQQKSQDQQVKQIAQRIIQDHGQMMQQLQNVAQAQNVTLPKSLPAMHQQEARVLQSLDGKQFDQCFLSAMRCMHAKDLSKFQDVSQIAQNAEVKQFARQQLPTLTAHRADVDRAAVAMGLPSTSAMPGEPMPAGSTIRGSGTGTGTGTGTGDTDRNRSGTGGGSTGGGGGGGGGGGQ